MVHYVAFLRGINVGGHRKVPMADLRTIAEGLGLIEPKTLLQSGNLLFSAAQTSAEKLEKSLRHAAQEALGMKIDFYVRSQRELESVVADNPFPDIAREDPGHLLVHFLMDGPSREEVKRVEDSNEGPEKLVAVGRELFVSYPDGVGASKLKLPFYGTARNWNTVLKVARALDTR